MSNELLEPFVKEINGEIMKECWYLFKALCLANPRACQAPPLLGNEIMTSDPYF